MNSFLSKTYEYLVERINDSLQSIDLDVMQRCLEILRSGRKDKRVIIDGAGRSLQSALLLAHALEFSYGIRVNQVSNANLRPLRKGDIFIVNSRSGKGKSLRDAKFALKRGLDVIYITSNEDRMETFENVLLIKGNKDRKKEHAPLGTEFEQSSAVLCSCMGNVYEEQDYMEAFKKTRSKVIEGFNNNLEGLKTQEKTISNFLALMDDYLVSDNDNVVYFKGVGINEIISRVIAIRYGHLHKEKLKDLWVIYEGHWKSRKKNDLAILMSGSGETNQILQYARQAGDVGMNLFVITSFKESSLARTNRWYRKSHGSLILRGREDMVSYFNKSLRKIEKSFFPQFELNAYLTLDSLLALITHNHDINEQDMKKTHRDKELE